MKFNDASLEGMTTISDVAEPGELGPLLVAGIAVLVHRHMDRSAVTIDYVEASGRRALRTEIDVGDDPSFAELVGRAVEALDAARASASPAHELPAPDLEDPQVPDAVIALADDAPAARGHSLRLTVHPSEGGTSLSLDSSANGGRDPDEQKRLLGHLRMILGGRNSDAGSPISALDMLTEREAEQLLVDWNQTAAEYPQRTLHELVTEQSQKTPERIAIEYEGERLSYGELDARSSQLAHLLIERGVKADVLVGICVERSTAMLVGLLGILKAGGAYVPIDPKFPAERQAFMLANSQAPVLLTEERLVATLPARDIDLVCLDRDWPAIAARPTSSPERETDPDQLAYVIYTSGSTGQPKGVQISHRALVNFLWTMREVPGLAPSDVLVAVTTLSFDIAGLELYLPLIVGARIVLASAQTASDPRALAALLHGCNATVMQATPTTWRMLLDSGWQAADGLKALCGGEALPASLAERLTAARVELWNMYGPTETTIWSTCSLVGHGEAPTIGRPIANTKLYILDRHMRPVPVGVAGELWIGGDGLARGYRGRPDLTEERFVADPFEATDGARLYRTGDLARYRGDGRVEFLGRTDHQVKVRGFRIELGEIETVLARHPGVLEAVVLARGHGEVAELAAYVIADGDPVAARELREYAAESLPAYMVPQTVTTLESFPLTPNGKVDRKALPEPTHERSSDHVMATPQTPLERRLAAIWERELGIQPIGVDDDFFDLGVTSLAAATLFAAIEHELGGELPLGAIFKAPTIRALAQLLEGGATESRWTSLIPIQPEGSGPPIFCVHGGAGTILHLAALARRLGPGQPFYGLQARGLYGGAAPLRTVEEMATHYLSEMREVCPRGPWYLAGYCFGTIVAFEMAQRLTAEGEDVRLLAMFNGPSPTWIKRWGWYGNQPSYLRRHPRPPVPSEPERRRGVSAARRQRLARGVRDPRRLLTGLAWQLRGPRTRLALALGRPVPEPLRERFFFSLHARAEEAYEPRPYANEIVIFRGEGLYEDPTLGWEEFAAGGMASYAVPGEHDNNRQAMMEPAVAFVSARLRERLPDRG